jgi:mitogen-activated protein kinase-activated protein kinase 2
MNINQLTPKKSKIEDDFIITSKILGEGVNGKVLACIHRKTREKFALKVNFFE